MTFCCRHGVMSAGRMSAFIICFLLAFVNGIQVPGPGPGRQDSYSVQSQPQYSLNLQHYYTAFPRRRSSIDGQMQSRAVDTRVQLEVLEGEPRGTVVGYIPTKKDFTYRFNEPPREFVLDQNTGEIRTNVILDREGIRDRYDFVVLSSQPTYPIEHSSVILRECCSWTRLLLDAATDRDIGTNSVTDNYQIVDGNLDDKFRLAVTTNPSGDVSYLHLETTGNLDRETTGFYVLNISAQDGGSPPKYGYLQVNVTIVDVNDNPPIFDQGDYTSSLNESVLPGTQFLQAKATDADLGDNARITYYLDKNETQFTVDPENGWISTTRRIACPQEKCASSPCPKSCVFTVFADDHGSPQQTGRAYVTVNLVDTNDHDPIIKFQYFSPTGNIATVDENAVNGSVVAAVSVDDKDEGLNGQTTIRIISGNEKHHFRLDRTPSFDIVRVNGVLDREEISKYNLTVVATDKGSPPRTATANLIIEVNDVNDHEPVFEKSEYSAVLSELAASGFVSGNDLQWFHIDQNSGLIITQSMLDREQQGTIELNISAKDGGPNPKYAYTQLKVTILDENDEAPQFSQPEINVTLSEDTPPHTLIATLTASDHDQGTNGSVTYTFPSLVEQKYPETFALDSLTGQLTTKIYLDREQTSHFEILVIARDQGIPPQSSTATVHLRIEDVNDNSPVFYPKQYYHPINDDDNIGIGTSLLQVHATDLDEGDNALITYHMERNPGTAESDFFTIDTHTGVVQLRTDLSGLVKPSYKLMISAKDRGDRRSERDAIVEIFKQSKMEPIEFDSFSGYEFQITEDHEDEMKGREVGQVQVVDNSGIIRTSKRIDRETMIQYQLTIIARVGNIGGGYGKTIVNISILDLNDNPPIFSHDDRDVVLLMENTAVGQEVYLSRARDKDSGINSRVSYNLTTNPHQLFRISESTGVLYLNRPIKLPPGTQMNVEIMATDGGNPPLSTKHTISLQIVDVNDHTPVFDAIAYETSLLESTSINTRFFTLEATDADFGQNGRISYNIIDGNVDEKFGIFPDGYLYVKSHLDREERDYYSLTISCQDHGLPEARSSEVPVTIHIIDENDNPPQFTNTSFTFTLPENEPIDTFVGKLTATDRDVGRNAELIYSLVSRENDFTIDSRNGFIKTLRSFDREECDNGQPRMRDKVKIFIHITDVNDNAPEFLRAPYKVQISEGAALGTQVIRLYTVDVDDGLNGDVYYKIADGNQDGKFSIDDSTGEVQLVKKLDRESKEFYKLKVVAHDAALKGQLNTTTTITIDVLDENDNAPKFLGATATMAATPATAVDVNETTPIGTELVQFRATDDDMGVNSQIIFSITAGNRKDTFHIDASTGSLYLHKNLDYEDTTSYMLNVTASDAGTPKLSTTIMFTVNVVDENDNPPSFPNTAIVRQIKEGIPVKTSIVTITAEDPDSGVNGKVTYAISNQDPENHNRHFGINPTSDQAVDVGKRLSAEKLVTVIVEDVNDNAPVFVSMNAAILPVPDGSLTVMHALARDADSSTNGIVTYELVGGNTELFQLHRSSGAITLKRPIEQLENRYKLAIKATDEAVQSERKSTEAYINIIAVDNSQNGPVFDQLKQAGSVYENEPIGTSILTVSARLNSFEIEYYVTNVTTTTGQQVDRLFDIDPKLGILSTAKELDREAGWDTYEVEVYAITLGGMIRTSKTKSMLIICPMTLSITIFIRKHFEHVGDELNEYIMQPINIYLLAFDIA
uniref:Cadherin domain-containing protein n=1 Tax=Megaselia scalaris TaxID=36166 RepID=T1GLD3_MEGSC